MLSLLTFLTHYPPEMPYKPVSEMSSEELENVRAIRRERNRKWRASLDSDDKADILLRRRTKHNEYIRKRYAERKAAGLCTYCGQKPPIPGILHCEECRQKRVKKDQKRGPKRYHDLRREAMLMITKGKTPVCERCGCDMYKALEMHHRNNDGYQDRKKYRHTANMLRAIRDGIRPTDDLMVSCAACNRVYFAEEKFGGSWEIKWRNG